MFWGKGDTSRLEDQEAQTLSDLRRMVETGHIVALSPKESEVAIRAINFYDTWESTFRLFGSVRNTIILLGFLATFWYATEGTLIEFITGMKK